MNKILIAVLVFGAGAGAFQVAHKSTAHFRQEAQTAREARQIEAQRVAAARSQQVRLKTQIEDVERIIREREVVAEDPAWSALQTNPISKLSPELQERLREELGFQWTYSPAYIIVSKETVRQLNLPTLDGGGKISDLATKVLVLTPQECSQLVVALQQIPAQANAWALANIERLEPQGDEVAHYRLPPVQTMARSLSNSLAAAVEKAVGRERAALIMQDGSRQIDATTGAHLSAPNPDVLGMPVELILKRYFGKDGQVRLGLQMDNQGRLPLNDLSRLPAISPPAFRPIFTNGWADLAKREGFELPKGPP